MSPKRRDWTAASLVFLATLAVYWPALHNGFVNLDDFDAIVSNPHIRGLAWSDIKWMFTSVFYSTYQPLCWLIDAFLYRCQGLDPFGFHAASLLFHAGNAAAVYFLAARLLRLGGREAPEIPLCAAIAALAFALHPMHVEDVAWADGLADLMAVFFFLASILAYLSSVERRSRAWLAASWFLFLLSALSRWRGISLPLVLVVLDIFPLRRQSKPWLEKLPFFLVAGLLLLVNAKAKFGVHDFAVSFRPREFAAGSVFLLGHLLFPADLAPAYLLDGARSPGLWPFAAITAGAIWARRRPALVAVWFCCLISLAPRLAFAAAGPILILDQYAYHACIGFFLLAAGGLRVLRSRRLQIAAALAALPVLGWLSREQMGFWHDSVSLWTHSLSVDPDSALAHANLGDALLRQGRYEEALWHFRRDYHNGPKDLIAKYNLSNVLSLVGPLKADWAKWHSNLGADLLRQGDLDGAFWHFTKAVQINPRLAEAHNNLGILLGRRGDFAEAVAHYEAALKLDPGDASAHNNMGSALARAGRVDEAAAHFKEALRLEPGYGEARENLERLAVLKGP